MSTPRNLSDRYELGQTLGFGGMSEVHSGRDLRLDRDVAVKVLRADLARDPSFYLRFRREAQNAAALNHPAIVAVYDTGEAQDEDGQALPYIVMEHVDGDTLRDLLRADGPMSPRRAMEIMGDVCAALDFSHRHGIVHRDVKPANIMINRAGAVKVMDFGIARAIADGTSTMTQTAAVIGTAQYLSPEQARGEQVDARSDVYAAGCVLFELLTAEPPFTGDSPVAVAYQHVREDPRLPSSLNAAVAPALDSVVLKAMSKNPANRYQTAAEMRTDLVRVLAGQRPSAPSVMTDEDRTEILGAVPPAPPGKHRPDDQPRRREEDYDDDDHPGRRRALIAAVSVLGVALIVLVGVFLNALNSGGQPKQVAVPSLVGQSSVAAQNALTDVNLKPKLEPVADAKVRLNNVARTDPPAGTPVAKNSTVTLFVSTGPKKVTVPTLVNLTRVQALAALKRIGLQGKAVDPPVASDTVAKDSVISANPTEGSSVDAGIVVKLTISSGKAQVQVPIVLGQTQKDAKANLTSPDLNLKVTVNEVDSSAAKGTVVDQNPTGGTKVGKGSPVTISVSRGNRVKMPDLTGKDRTNVLSILTNLGYTGNASNITMKPVPNADPNKVGKVLLQNPAANTDIEPSQPITVTYGAAPPTTTSNPPPTTTTTTTPTPTPTPTPTTAPAPSTPGTVVGPPAAPVG